MEYATKPEQANKKDLWLALNDGHMQRPMVLLDQIPWHEMDVDGLLVNQVQDEYWRGVETELRQSIYKLKFMPADATAEPILTLPRPIHLTGYGLKIDEEIAVLDRENSVVGHFYHKQINDFEDIQKIRPRQAVLDEAKEKEIIQQAASLFEGIAPFRLTGLTLHLGVWDTITQWMGAQNIFFELMDRPELMHSLMEHMTSINVALIEQMSRDRLFDAYTQLCHCSHTYSSDLPRPGSDPAHPQSQDVWAYGLAQLFSSVSPEVTAEFEVAYVKRFFAHFGAIYYGCCDRLDDRMDVIAALPNVRKLSCSPWSIREVFAQRMPKHCVMSNKPNPAMVSVGFDEGTIRTDLRRTIAAAKAGGVGLEFILKDISTVQYQPQRLWDWSRIALEEVSR